MNRVINGDCLEELKKLADDSVDLLCTDPPYGYSFMGKDWDKAVPSVEVWKECLRVLKPGAFAFIMSAPRQDVLSQMIVRIGEAGFDTSFTSIYWTYASGFPKAMNIGKMVDKRAGAERTVVGLKTYPDGTTARKTANHKSYIGSDITTENTSRDITAPATPEAKALDGSYGGFQPKPAVEVIIVAMKPLSEKTYVDQALKNGKGITWLDDCRVPTNEKTERPPSLTEWSGDFTGGHTKNGGHESGRFPANLLVSDDVLNDGVERKSPKPYTRGSTDEQRLQVVGHKVGETSTHKGDSGSYSRYFDLDAWAKTLPFLIVPKASKREKNEGLEGMPEKQKVFNGQSGKPSKDIKDVEARMMTKPSANHHPTVKPIKLMSYLITLGSREGDVVLDPFLGSGTTACAAKALGRNYIGIEKSREYAEIARARIFHKHTPEQQRLFDRMTGSI